MTSDSSSDDDSKWQKAHGQCSCKQEEVAITTKGYWCRPHKPTLNSHPVTQEDVMAWLYLQFPPDSQDPKAPNPQLCHLCQQHDGHKCSTDGCLGMLCSMCNIGTKKEHKYICHWCNASLEVIYSPVKNVTSVRAFSPDAHAPLDAFFCPSQ